MTEKPPQSTWFIPATITRLPDGTTVVRPGKAVQRTTLSLASKITGVHARTLRSLSECGMIRKANPSPGQTLVYPAEIEELLRKTEEDPHFWNAVRTAAFLKGKSLRTATTAKGKK